MLIPIQCEYYALEGISQLLNTIRLVQQNFNPALAIDGVLLTMYDARLNLCRQVAEDAKEYFGARMFVTPIPRNVRLAEAPSFGKPILLYDVQSVGAKSYLAVAQELMRRVERGGAPPLPALPATDRRYPHDRDAGRRRLGRGLEALLGPTREQAEREVLCASCRWRHPAQSVSAATRRRSTAARGAGRRSQAGLLQPVVVRPARGHGVFELIAGERRCARARRWGGRRFPPCVKDVDDRTLLTLALIENLQRDDLSPIDEAARLPAAHRGVRAAARTWPTRWVDDRSTVANALRLLKLPDDVLQMLHERS